MKFPGMEHAPQNSLDVFLIVSNGALVVFAAGFIWFTSVFYREKGAEISLRESRFVTTEWSLMQTLKANTDRQLMDKEQEILALRRRYLQLVQNPESSQGLSILRSQLQKAEEERRDILSLSLKVPASPTASEEENPPSPAEPAAIQQSTPAGSASTIFQSRIMVLESQLADERALSLALSTALDTISKDRDLAIRTFRAELDTRNAAIERLSTAGKSALETLSAGSQDIAVQRQALGLDLNTKVLLRAIASSPEIRAYYPDLLDSLDHYLEQLALMERLRGQAETYAAVTKALEPLQQALSQE
jgi:hypothetical protein